MSGLSDDEKKRFVEIAIQHILPIAEKYELDYEIGKQALIEAFQAGIQFVVKEAREVDNGGSE